MPRLDPRPLLQRGQTPQVPRRRRYETDLTPTGADLNDLSDYIDKLVSALENTRREFAPKLELTLEVDQATTSALAAVVWEVETYDNGGLWTDIDPTIITIPLAGIYQGVFQTKLSGSGTIRIQLSVNGSLVERGMDVTLAGDFTYSFAWQGYYDQDDELQIHVSTGSSRNLLAAWTKLNLHHLDYLEAV